MVYTGPNKPVAPISDPYQMFGKLYGKVKDRELLASVLRELSNACVVVNSDLLVVHANKSARQYFGRGGKRGGELEFSDLPAALGTKIYQVLKTGTAITPFRFDPVENPKSVFANWPPLRDSR